jgi:hypothetical protein
MALSQEADCPEQQMLGGHLAASRFDDGVQVRRVGRVGHDRPTIRRRRGSACPARCDAAEIGFLQAMA